MADDLEFLVSAADLRLAEDESGDWLEHLAVKLELAIPQHVEVTRKKSLFSKDRPVSAIVARFGDRAYALKREGKRLVASQQTIVRNVVLKSQDVSVEAWTNDVAEALNALARESAQTRDALARLAR